MTIMMHMLRKAMVWKNPAFSDGVIDLYPLHFLKNDLSIGAEENYGFRITPCGTSKNAGEINLRIGESREMYYFGHIGYHVNMAHRGNRYAQKACRLIFPLCHTLNLRSLVITTDVDNLASRKTCEALGCILESITDVPEDLQVRFELSKKKCRYILVVPFH